MKAVARAGKAARPYRGRDNVAPRPPVVDDHQRLCPNTDRYHSLSRSSGARYEREMNKRAQGRLRTCGGMGWGSLALAASALVTGCGGGDGKRAVQDGDDGGAGGEVASKSGAGQSSNAQAGVGNSGRGGLGSGASGPVSGGDGSLSADAGGGRDRNRGRGRRSERGRHRQCR